MIVKDRPTPDITIDVDLRNPGQFFACCGLLELASRLWPGSEANGWRGPEGWFDIDRSQFAILTSDRSARLTQLITQLRHCPISGLSDDEARERAELEAKRKELSEELSKRRKDLGTKARKGALRLGQPFEMVLNWWEAQNTDDKDIPAKTWAGRQEIHKIARACQDSLAQLKDTSAIFNFEASLRVPNEYRHARTNPDETIEAFYFDARRFAHALDVGYSLDVLEANTVTYPGIELLCLIGLQRFRPKILDTNLFLYQCWSTRLPCTIAPAAAAAAIFVPGMLFHFRRLHRDDQKRYKAFDFATAQGELSWSKQT